MSPREVRATPYRLSQTLGSEPRRAQVEPDPHPLYGARLRVDRGRHLLLRRRKASPRADPPTGRDRCLRHSPRVSSTRRDRRAVEAKLNNTVDRASAVSIAVIDAELFGAKVGRLVEILVDTGRF